MGSTRRLLMTGLAASATMVVLTIACGPGDLSALTRGEATLPGPGTDAGPVDTCDHAVEPKAPPQGTTDESSGPAYTFAANDLRIETGQDPDGGLPKPQGIDLDNTCTICSADKATVVTSCVAASTGGQQQCDDKNGRDDAMGALIASSLTLLSGALSPTEISRRVKAGLFSVLVTVFGWNGKPDDEKVAVSMTMSPGVEGEKDPSTGRPFAPKNDGSDVWSVEASSVADGDNHINSSCATDTTDCAAIATDLFAYVSGGKLVAHFAQVPFAVGQQETRIAIPYTSAVLLADITTTTLSGELAGRWSAADVLTGMQHFQVPESFTNPGGPQVPLCTSAAYAGVKSAICSALDLAAKPDLDRTNVKCTALSESLRFAANTAQLGTIQRADPGSSQTDACNGVTLDTTCP